MIPRTKPQVPARRAPGPPVPTSPPSPRIQVTPALGRGPWTPDQPVTSVARRFQLHQATKSASPPRRALSVDPSSVRIRQVSPMARGARGEGDFAALREQLERVTAFGAEYRAKFSALSRAHEAAVMEERRKREKAEQELHTCKAQLTTLDAECAAHAMRNTALTAQVKYLKEQLQATQNRNNSMARVEDSTRDGAEGLREELHVCKAESKRLRSELAALEHEVQHCRQTHCSELETSSSRIEGLSDELQVSKAESAQLAAEVSRLRAALQRALHSTSTSQASGSPEVSMLTAQECPSPLWGTTMRSPPEFGPQDVLPPVTQDPQVTGNRGELSSSLNFQSPQSSASQTRSLHVNGGSHVSARHASMPAVPLIHLYGPSPEQDQAALRRELATLQAEVQLQRTALVRQQDATDGAQRLAQRLLEEKQSLAWTLQQERSRAQEAAHQLLVERDRRISAPDTILYACHVQSPRQMLSPREVVNGRGGVIGQLATLAGEELRERGLLEGHEHEVRCYITHRERDAYSALNYALCIATHCTRRPLDPSVTDSPPPSTPCSPEPISTNSNEDAIQSHAPPVVDKVEAPNLGVTSLITCAPEHAPETVTTTVTPSEAPPQPEVTPTIVNVSLGLLTVQDLSNPDPLSTVPTPDPIQTPAPTTPTPPDVKPTSIPLHEAPASHRRHRAAPLTHVFSIDPTSTSSTLSSPRSSNLSCMSPPSGGRRPSSLSSGLRWLHHLEMYTRREIMESETEGFEVLQQTMELQRSFMNSYCMSLAAERRPSAVVASAQPGTGLRWLQHLEHFSRREIEESEHESYQTFQTVGTWSMAAFHALASQQQDNLRRTLSVTGVFGSSMISVPELLISGVIDFADTSTQTISHDPAPVPCPLTTLQDAEAQCRHQLQELLLDVLTTVPECWFPTPGRAELPGSPVFGRQLRSPTSTSSCSETQTVTMDELIASEPPSVTTSEPDSPSPGTGQPGIAIRKLERKVIFLLQQTGSLREALATERLAHCAAVETLRRAELQAEAEELWSELPHDITQPCPEYVNVVRPGSLECTLQPTASSSSNAKGL